jgi:hypothetical protein
MKLNYYPSSHDSNEQEISKRIKEYISFNVNVDKDEYSSVIITTENKLENNDLKNLDMSMMSLGYRRIN